MGPSVRWTVLCSITDATSVVRHPQRVIDEQATSRGTTENSVGSLHVMACGATCRYIGHRLVRIFPRHSASRRTLTDHTSESSQDVTTVIESAPRLDGSMRSVSRISKTPQSGPAEWTRLASGPQCGYSVSARRALNLRSQCSMMMSRSCVEGTLPALHSEGQRVERLQGGDNRDRGAGGYSVSCSTSSRDPARLTYLPEQLFRAQPMGIGPAGSMDSPEGHSGVGASADPRTRAPIFGIQRH